jgi:hypothetical protein
VTAGASFHSSAASDVGGIALRLLEDVYGAWTRAQLECHNALLAWLASGSRNHAAYHAYRAALDREEAAAVDLERLSHLVTA